MFNMNDWISRGIQELVRHTGLNYHPATWLVNAYLNGIYRHRAITVDTFGTKPHYLRIVLSVSNPKRLALEITNQNVFHRLEKLLGRGVRTGDPTFDDRFAIKSRPIVLAQDLGSSATLRRRLGQCYGLTIRLRDQELNLVCYEAYLADTPYVLHLFNLLDVMAKAIEDYETHPREQQSSI